MQPPAPSESSAMKPISVDWHLWPRCNYECRFCFAQFSDIRTVLDKADALRVLPLLHAAGTQKITFVGGEPTLCPYLPDLITQAKELGMTTMVVTNASRLTRPYLERLQGLLDWISISIDSASEAIQQQMGRGHGNHVAIVRNIAPVVRQMGFRLKINTVVTAINRHDDMSDLISELAPDRWKVFQMLPIKGENDDAIPALAISADEFRAYIAHHKTLNPVAEDNAAMTGSYVMLDALGRLFHNTSGRHEYSRPILDVGLRAALTDVEWNTARFLQRGGLYDWATPSPPASRPTTSFVQ